MFKKDLSLEKPMTDVFSTSRLSKNRKIVDKIKGTNRGNLYEVIEIDNDRKCKNTRCRDYALRMYDASSALSKNGISSHFIRQIQGYTLRHPNLLEIYDVDMVFNCDDFNKKECRTTYLLILYELSSGNLEHWLDVHRKNAEIFETVKLINDILQGLYYIHSENYVHRRLHPSNILLVEEVEKKQKNHFVAKMGDFQDLSVFYQTEKDNPLPIPHKHTSYFAPEILLDYEHYLPCADMWSLGVLIYEILFGKGYTPFYVEKEDNRMFKIKQKEHVLGNIFQWLGTPDVRWRQQYMHHHNIHYEPNIGMSIKDKFKVDKTLKSRLKSTGYLERKADAQVLDMLIDLMDACLRINPEDRITATEALHHPVFERFGIPVVKYPIIPIPKTPSLYKGHLCNIRKEIIRTTARDIELGMIRYYPALMAIYIFDRVLPLLIDLDNVSDKDVSTMYQIFCAAYVIGMKLLTELEHPQHTLLNDIKGIVCGDTEANRLNILHMERLILVKLNFKLYPNEIAAMPVTMSIFKILENETLDPRRVLKK